MYTRHFTCSQILLRSVLFFRVPFWTALHHLVCPLEAFGARRGDRWQFTQHALLYLGHPVRKKKADGCRWSVLVPPTVSLSYDDRSVCRNERSSLGNKSSIPNLMENHVCLLRFASLVKNEKYKILLCLEKKNEHGNLWNTSVVSSRQQWD